jgi:hypothetical protein
MSFFHKTMRLQICVAARHQLYLVPAASPGDSMGKALDFHATRRGAATRKWLESGTKLGPADNVVAPLGDATMM